MPNPRLDFLAAVWGLDPQQLQARARKEAILKSRKENESSASGLSGLAKNLGMLRSGPNPMAMLVQRGAEHAAGARGASISRNLGGPYGYAQDDMMRRASALRGQSAPGGFSSTLHSALGHAPMFGSAASMGGPDGQFDPSGVGRMGLDAVSFMTMGFNPAAMAAGEVSQRALAGVRADPIAKAIASQLAASAVGGGGAAGSMASKSPAFQGSPMGQMGTSTMMGVAQGTMQRMQQIRQNRQNQKGALGFQPMPRIPMFNAPPPQGGFMQGGF